MIDFERNAFGIYKPAEIFQKMNKPKSPAKSASGFQSDE